MPIELSGYVIANLMMFTACLILSIIWAALIDNQIKDDKEDSHGKETDGC